VKTAARGAEEEHWVVDVEDVPSLEKDLPGYRQRFEFRGDDSYVRAWTCWANAERQGFKSKVERVRKP